MTRFAQLGALCIAVAALAATPALAGKPGSGSGTSASVSASPNPAQPGSTVWLQGCGYNTNYPAEVSITSSTGSTQSYAVTVWYTGCLNPTPIVAGPSGSYTIAVYQRPTKPRNAASQFKASTVLIVQ